MLRLPPEENQQTACFKSMDQIQAILDQLEQFKKDNFTRQDKDCIIFMLLEAQNARTLESDHLNQERGATIEVEDDKMEEIEAMERTALARDQRSLRMSQFYQRGTQNGGGGPRHLTTLLDQEIKRNQQEHLVPPLMASTQQYIKLDDMLPEEKKPFPKFFLPKQTDLSLFEQLRLQEGGTAQALEAFDQIESSRQRQNELEEEEERKAIALEECQELPSQKSAFNLRRTLKQTEREILMKFIKEMPATVQVLDDSYSHYRGGEAVKVEDEEQMIQGIRTSMLPTLKSPSPLPVPQECTLKEENQKSEERETTENEANQRKELQILAERRSGDIVRREIKFERGKKQEEKPAKKKRRQKSGCFCLGNYK